MKDLNNKTNISLGLNINDFMPGGGNQASSSCEQYIPSKEKVPESKDPPIIDDIYKMGPNYKLLISTRKKIYQMFLIYEIMQKIKLILLNI